MNKLKNKLKVNKRHMKKISLYLSVDIINELKELSKFNELSINKVAAHLIHTGYEQSKEEKKSGKEKAS
jgi:tartrate dehydratase alpha subunit/fumarate hydratase class I-like protein